MKFLADQDVYAITTGFLRGLGHEVVSAAQLGLAQADDADLLRVAQEQERILATATSGRWSLSMVTDRESFTCAFCLRPRMLCMPN